MGRYSTSHATHCGTGRSVLLFSESRIDASILKNRYDSRLGGTALTFIAFLTDPLPIGQIPEFDPADSEPVPDDDFDQSRTW